MSLASYAFGILAAVVAVIAVVELLRRKHVRERHAVWWLVAAVLGLIMSVFPGLLAWAASLLGIAVPANLAFFISILILFFVSVQHGAELTVLEEKTRTLAEHVALLEERLRTSAVDGKTKNRQSNRLLGDKE